MEQEREWEQIEYRLLCRTVQDACRAEGRGDEFAAYRCLALNREHAEEMAASAGWGEELAEEYLAALAHFGELPHVTRDTRS